MRRLEAYFPSETDEIMLEPLTQWDKDILLHISGDDLPECFEVHIGYVGIREAKRYQVQKVNGVATINIPNSFLQQTKNIKVWAYVIDAEGCRTEKTVIIPIDKRERPTDAVQIMDESQKDSIEQLIERSNVLISDYESLQAQNKAILEGLDTLDALADSTLEKQNAYIGGGSE